MLTAANSYTGVTNIQQGTLEVTSPAALGSTAGGTNVADGAVLVINHGTGFSEAITLNGLSNPDGALQSGSVNNYGVGGTITLAATSNVGTPTRALTLNGKITGPGGLVKVGNGTLYLGNTTNDYQGSTVIDGGVLKLIHSNTIPDTSDLTINNGARFDNVERPTSDTVGLVTINQGSITGSASTVITSNAGFRLHEGSVSAVLGGTGELWKESATTFTLSQANTYTGDTRINDGTLALTSDGSIHASPAIYLASTGVLDVSGVTGGDYTLAGGQTLTGSGGVVGALTIGDGSIVSPGSSPGTLTHTGDETWAGGGTYLWEINSANGTLGADPGWDYLDISGTLTIDATPSDPFDVDITSLTLAGSAGLVSDFHSTGIYSWTIATADGGVVNFSPESFNLVLDDFANDWSAGQWSIDLIGNSVVLSFAVPEAFEHRAARIAAGGRPGLRRPASLPQTIAVRVRAAFYGESALRIKKTHGAPVPRAVALLSGG